MLYELHINLFINEPHHDKTCFSPYANNKGADQHAQPPILISAFVVRCLVNIIHLNSIPEISRLYLPSLVAHIGLCNMLTWSQSPKTGFLVTRLKCCSYLDQINRLQDV